MNSIKNWFYRRSLKAKKEKLLHEVLMDIKFIESYRSESLNRSYENKLRDELSTLRKANQLTGKQQARVDEISDIISNAQAVREEYQKLKVIAKELPAFINML